MFNIKIPFVVATHVKKYTSTSGLKNKNKAGAVGVVSNVPYFHDGTRVIQVATGKRSVISGQGATATLTAAQSGSIVLFDRAAGIVYTLPAPVAGLWYEFVITTTITSNAAKVITDAGTTFMNGVVRIASAGTAGDFQGNGTAHVAISQNGSTTGGVLGTHFFVQCVSSTLWNVSGQLMGSGVTATPFANS